MSELKQQLFISWRSGSYEFTRAGETAYTQSADESENVWTAQMLETPASPWVNTPIPAKQDVFDKQVCLTKPGEDGIAQIERPE